MHPECALEACTKATLKLLEPMMKVEVVTPEEFMGDVIGDLVEEVRLHQLKQEEMPQRLTQRFHWQTCLVI